MPARGTAAKPRVYPFPDSRRAANTFCCRCFTLTARAFDKQACIFPPPQHALLPPSRVRAFSGWPGTWAMFSWGKDGGADPEARKVKLITTAVGDTDTGGGAGGTTAGERQRRVLLRGDALELTCADGSVLRVLELQPLNKKVMNAKAFANGLRGEELSWVELEPVEEAVPA